MPDKVHFGSLTLPTGQGTPGLYASPFRTVYIGVVVRATGGTCEIYIPIKDGLKIEDFAGASVIVGENQFGTITADDVRKIGPFTKSLTPDGMGLVASGFSDDKVNEFIAFLDKTPPPSKPAVVKKGSGSASSLFGGLPSRSMKQGLTVSGKSEPFKLQNAYQLKDGSFAINSPDVLLTKRTGVFGGDKFTVKVTGETPILIPVALTAAVQEKRVYPHWTNLLLEADTPTPPAPAAAQTSPPEEEDVIAKGKGGNITVKRTASKIKVARKTPPAGKEAAGAVAAAPGDATGAEAATTAAADDTDAGGTNFAFVPVTEIEWEFEGNYLNYGQGGSPAIKSVSYKPAGMPNLPNVMLIDAKDANKRGARSGNFDAVETGIKRLIQSDDTSLNPTGRPLYLTQTLNNAMNTFVAKSFRVG